MSARTPWSDFIEDIVTRLDIDNAGLARLVGGVSPGAIGQWRNNPAITVSHQKIRDLTDTPEVAKLGYSYLDGLIAAGILTREDLGRKVSNRLWSLEQYDDNEIGREVTKRLNRLSEKLKNGN